MAVRNGQFQLIGDSSGPTMAKRNSTIPSPSANPKSGLWQNIGTQLDMSRKPIYSPSANPPEGSYQIVGDQKRMSRSPINDAWGSAYRTPMSRESSDSDNNAAHHQKGGRNSRKKHSY